MTERTIFVTGMQRSGTTLLARLLSCQPRVSLLSQPFPLLFTAAKADFLQAPERYPLGHLFRESRYSREDFRQFLECWRPDRARLEQIFREMDSYSGQYVRFPEDRRRSVIDRIPPDHSFAQAIAFLDRGLAGDGAAWVGSKETICEEFIPALLDAGVHCFVIVRDPRDIVASLNHGRGQEFGGAVKPTLWNIRNWRKSVAFILAMAGRRGFQWCRYEDLVAAPGDILLRLTSALGMDPILVPAELTDSDGEPWLGNSSHTIHRGVATSSVGVHRSLLPSGLPEFIEAACLPELRYLGYETSMTHSDARRILHQFSDPYPLARTGMEQERTSPDNARAECERLDRLQRDPSETSEYWFLFREAHDALRTMGS